MTMLAIHLVIEFVICQCKNVVSLEKIETCALLEPCPEALPSFRASWGPHRKREPRWRCKTRVDRPSQARQGLRNYRFEQGIRTRWQTFAGPSTELETGRSKARSRPRQLDCTPRRRAAYPTGSLVRNRECQRNPATKKASWYINDED